MPLPTDWTNQSPTTDDHPGDHNAAGVEVNALGPVLDGYLNDHVRPRWNVDTWIDSAVGDRWYLTSQDSANQITPSDTSTTRTWHVKHGSLFVSVNFPTPSGSTIGTVQYVHGFSLPAEPGQIVGRWVGPIFSGQTPVRAGLLLASNNAAILTVTSSTGSPITGNRNMGASDRFSAYFRVYESGFDESPV